MSDGRPQDQPDKADSYKKGADSYKKGGWIERERQARVA